MVEATDLAFAVTVQAFTDIQIMQSNMRRSEYQDEHQRQPDQAVLPGYLVGVLVECFHRVVILS